MDRNRRGVSLRVKTRLVVRDTDMKHRNYIKSRFSDTSDISPVVGATRQRPWPPRRSMPCVGASTKRSCKRGKRLLTPKGSVCVSFYGCGSHLHQHYDYDRSSDFERLNCSSRAEDAALCTAIHRADCQSDGTCGYSVHYLGDGSSVGYAVRDTFFFDGTIADTTLVFGCETAAENGILTSKKDGPVGFGHGVNSFHAQLAKAGAINGNTFGICGQGFFDSTLGLITLGV